MSGDKPIDDMSFDEYMTDKLGHPEWADDFDRHIDSGGTVSGWDMLH